MSSPLRSIRRPLPQKFVTETIPEELRILPQWVAWKRTPDNKKIPVNPTTGGNASTTDPGTWGTFDQAAEAVSKHNWQGVGFVFTATDPYIGIDLDKCRDYKTGAVEPWAQKIVDSLASYTELSPSGTGLHILVKGEWPSGLNRKDMVEVYDRSRYFTVTGKVVDLKRTIFERTSELGDLRRGHFGIQSEVREKLQAKPSALLSPSLTDDEIIEKARNSAKSEKFEALWTGVWDGLFPSQSEAVLSLLNMLAFHAGNDRECVDRLFRRSGLYGDKWDEKRGGTTYGQKELDKVLGPIDDPAKAKHTFNGAVITFDQLEAMDLPEQMALLEPWLLESSLNLLSADAGTGKTFFALEVAAACAEGRKAMDGRWNSPKSTSVLIVDGEMLPVEIRKRGHLLGMSGHCKLISKALFEKANPQHSLNLADKLVRDWLLNYVQEQRISLLIIDNIYSLFNGLDSNSDREWQPMNEWLLKLKSVGVAVLIVHHTNKKGEQLGTSSRVFNLDTHLVLKKPKGKTKHATFTLDFTKYRHERKGADDGTFEFIDGQWVVTAGEAEDSDTDQTRREVAQKLVDGLSQKQIAADLECTPSYVSQIKQGFIRDGLITEDKSTKPSVYTLTDSGEEWLHPVEE